jgi:Tc toxin complex TcA C-terminal TcB-binding domain
LRERAHVDEAGAAFAGRIVDATTGAGRVDLRVRATQVSGDGSTRIDETRSDSDGRFSLSLARLEPARGRWLRLAIADRTGRLLAEEDVPVGVEEVVAIAVPGDDRGPDIDAAAKAARVKITPVLAAWLRKRRLKTLEDVRRAGGIARARNLPVKPGSAVVTMLDGLAALGTLPGDLEAKAKLVRRGYADIVTIARTPEPTFLAALGDDLDEEQAGEIHRAADVQAGLLANVLTQARLGIAGSSIQRRVDAAVPRACGCPDCLNALSPMAYLADLLDYAVRHLLENQAPLTLTRLAERFRQPFATLPATCEAVETPVHRVRIAIEVLRSYFGFTTTPDWYPRLVFDTLLGLLGSSTAELRDARQAPDEVRAALAARLGVPVEPGKLSARQPDALDELFAPIEKGTLSEAAVESLFGFRDTRRSPTDPDPLTASQLFAWRIERLRSAWMAEDWPASPPATLRPLIDPDQVDAADFADQAGPAYALYLQRAHWIETRLAVKRDEREQFGLDAMLQDPPVSGLAPPAGVAYLLQLKADQAAGTPIDAQLAQLELGQAQFERIVAIAETDANATVLPEEWEEVYSILVAIEKRRMFATWRAEEQTAPPGLGTTPSGYFPVILSGAYFRLRPAPLAGDAAWRPKRWRSDPDARAEWVAKLRARIERERGVGESLRATIDKAEELTLPGLRDVLVALAPTPDRLSRADWLSRHLQIDAAAGACDVTTRVSQAITTVQGVLFGARGGLLEDEAITLAAPFFDEEWQWIGSYPSWRAAMSLFLHPETALQPVLRRRTSPGFKRLVADLQALDGAVDSEAARAAADRYAGYLDDVCSLREVAVRVSPRRVDRNAPAFFTADVLAIARADRGAVYMSGLNGRLKQQFTGPPGLIAVDEQSFWQEVDPLPAGTEVAGIVPHRVGSGPARLALYGREVVDGTTHLFQTTFDGRDWTRPAARLGELPGLVCAARVPGLVPADSLSEEEVAPWPIRGDDWVVPADIDGDGRTEIVVFAAAVQAGRRAVGVLRERDALLVTSARDTVPAGLTPFVPGGPVIVRVTRSDWPVRPERILLGDPSSPSLALLGTTLAGPLTLMPLPSGPFGGFTLNFGDVVFTATDLDGDGDSELVIADHVPTTSSDEQGRVQQVAGTRMTVLRVTDTTLALRAQEVLPGQLFSSTFPGVADRWEGFQPVALGNGSQGLVVRTVHQYYTSAGNPGVTDEWRGVLRFDASANMFSPVELYGKAVADVGGTSYDWTPTTRLQPVELGNAGGLGSGPELLVTDPSTVETRVLARGSTAAGARYAAVWRAATEISRPAGSAARPWTRQTSDRFIAADLDGDGAQEIVAVSTSGRAGVLRWSTSAARLELGWATDGVVPPPGAAAGAGSLTPPLGSVDAGAAWLLQASDHYFTADVDGDGCDELVALSADGCLGLLRGLARPTSAALADTSRLHPKDVAPRTVEEKRSRSQLAERQSQALAAYEANSDAPPNLAYLDEAFYFVPVELGLRLARDGAYTAALDWLASVYDITRPPASRKVAHKLELEKLLTGQLVRAPDWLRDPLNPHAIAALRPNAYTRYTIITIVRTLLAYADAEFTLETSESVARALELYLTALELLGAPELAERLPGCSDIIGRVEIDVGEPEFRSLWQEVHALLADVPSADALTAAVRKIERLQASDREAGAMVAEARSIALEAGRISATLSTAVVDKTAALQAAVAAALADDHVATTLRTSLYDEAAPSAFSDNGSDGDRIPINAAGSGFIDDLPDRGGDEWIDGYFTQPSFSFCATPNPDVAALRTHAEANLAKIRTCRNIAGAATRIEAYAPSGAAETISDGRLPSPARRTAQPLPYRYSTLIKRAKQLAQVAMQAEASLLGTLERRDAAAYDELRARQDLELAEAGVRQKDLQLAQALEGVTMAQAGRDRAGLAHDRLVGLHRDADFRGNLQTSLGIMQVIYQLAKTVAAAEAGGGGGGEGAAGGESAGGLFTSGGSDLFGAITGLIKTISTWQDEVHKLEFDIKVAALDQRAAEAGLRAAQTGVQIAAQDRETSALRLDHTAAVAEFMARKFTGLALYEWMSGVLQDVYRYFLQQAAATARLAEAQLAFERQEIPPAFIQGDYWARPASLAATGGTKGLTGSDRLQRDIFALDQYAFRTDQRKLQLTKTISLAQLDPLGFRRFQETGVMHFATPGQLFDRDFPGHYLRLVKRVRVAVVGQIPPVGGIHTTLATTGISRVVRGSDFQTVVVARGPESVALTSPNPTSAVPELDIQPAMLVPFEHIGVDAVWELSMPKAANQFDFDSIADVLLTVDYTALDSPVLRDRVLSELDRHVTYQRLFSFRNELVDQWLDLQDSPAAATPNRVRFRTSRADFAPNLDDVRLDHVTLYFAPTADTPPAAWQTALQTRLAFSPDQGTTFSATADAPPVAGVITTLPGLGNTPLWDPLVSAPPRAPFGEWELTLPAAAAAVFAADEVDDLLFVIGYSGMLPRWPA